jgi:hypothetical protein
MTGRETAHESGRLGVINAKSWLESTTRVQIQFDVYQSASQCSLPLGNGETKAFDLVGLHIEEDGATTRCPLYVEVKNYNSVGDQPAQYAEYLEIVYRAALHEAQGANRHLEFMWLTWHPFAQTKWNKLCSEDELRDTLTNAASVGALDEGLVRVLPDRLWLVVLGTRQDDLTMGDHLLGEVRKSVIEKTRARP